MIKLKVRMLQRIRVEHGWLRLRISVGHGWMWALVEVAVWLHVGLERLRLERLRSGHLTHLGRVWVVVVPGCPPLLASLGAVCRSDIKKSF